jgi:hypothetical protein
LNGQARGNELTGLLASSGALRLKAEGVNVKAKVKAADWFLNPKEDVRSSSFLEDVATEFDVQGLELDWTCVCWDADFRWAGSEWSFHSFVGTKWNTVRKQDDKRLLKNSYRVLLTRARQGMIIYVPSGSKEDATRPPSSYDPVASFLSNCGIQGIPDGLP